jgi:hypothetical protein
MRNDIQIAKQGLNDLKKHVIGIFQINGSFELIINCKEETIDTLNITPFGIIQECCGIPKSFGKVVLFGNYLTMEDVLNDPFEWMEYIEQFNTK